MCETNVSSHPNTCKTTQGEHMQTHYITSKWQLMPPHMQENTAKIIRDIRGWDAKLPTPNSIVICAVDHTKEWMLKGVLTFSPRDPEGYRTIDNHLVSYRMRGSGIGSELLRMTRNMQVGIPPRLCVHVPRGLVTSDYLCRFYAHRGFEEIVSVRKVPHGIRFKASEEHLFMQSADYIGIEKVPAHVTAVCVRNASSSVAELKNTATEISLKRNIADHASTPSVLRPLPKLPNKLLFPQAKCI